MNLLEKLRQLGDRLGIIEIAVDPKKPSAPVKIQTRAITLDELMSLHIKDLDKLSQSSVEAPASFEEIFKAAGIKTPSGGWNVDRLQQFLESDRIRNMDRAEAQRETLKALAADKVDSADVIKDAILRDQAMDAFAELAVKKSAQWLNEKQRELQALKDQQKQLESQVATEQKRWKEWRSEKRQREKDMARAIGYLIDKPVITMDED